MCRGNRRGKALFRSTGITMMATILPCLSSDPRPVVRCDRCQRVQFFNANGHCRVCKALFFPEPQQPDPPPVTQEPEPKPDRSLYHLPGYIREIRQLRGLSQQGLAERMGVPRTYISKVELGGSSPTLHSLFRLANALGVSAAFLLSGGSGEDPLVEGVRLALPRLDEEQRTAIRRAILHRLSAYRQRTGEGEKESCRSARVA
jgi:transcriptional regulator with XRE-family HTH domain